MTIYATTITTEASSLADARKKMRAYRDLFQLQREILTYVRGTFRESRGGELVFLTHGSNLVEIGASAIKWFDPELKKQISIQPIESFDLILAS